MTCYLFGKTTQVSERMLKTALRVFCWHLALGSFSSHNRYLDSHHFWGFVFLMSLIFLPICIYPRPAPVRCYLTGGQAAMKFHVTLSVLFALKCPFCLQIAFKKWKWDVPVFSLQNICGTRDYPGSAPGHSSMSISETNAAKLELARTSLLYLWEACKGKTLKLWFSGD